MAKPMISEDDFKLQESLGKIKHVIIVMSGKGGVGKSTVSSNIASTMSQKGYEVGLMDIDITGPNIPKMFGVEDEQIEVDNGRLLPVIVPPSLKIMSMAFLLPSKDSPVVWRGPVKMGAIRQFLEDVMWGELDYLVVDMPPGTGDEAISIIQLIPKADGMVIVTTPQDVSLLDSRKSITFSAEAKIPIIGMGGIATAEDAIEFILAGATAVSIGTANFTNPFTTVEVIKGIEDYMRRHQVEDINSLTGLVK